MSGLERFVSTAMAGAALSALVGCGPAEDPQPADDGAIRVRVDRHGIPHVSARTDDELFHGYGYQLATDRLLQLEMWRRFAFGRRSEVLGGNAPGAFGATALQDDQLVRMFDIPRWGRLDAERMRAEDPEHWRLLQAWRGGINARIAEVRDGTVPPPFGFGPDALDFLPEPWEPDDPVIIMKMIHLGMDQTILYEILVTLLGSLAPEALASIELFEPARRVYQVPPEDRPPAASAQRLPPQRPPPGPATPLPPEALDPRSWRLPGGLRPGSNSWAVAGRHTEDGRPMLCGDPHLVFTLMGFMYAVHLDSKSRGGTFNTAGFAFAPGMGLMAGQTETVAWTPTSAFGDVMDLWGAVVDADGAHVGGQVFPVEYRYEVIRERDGNDVEVEYQDVAGLGVVFQGSFTGVPIPIAPGGRQAIIGWTGFKGRDSRYFLELNRAESVADFEARVDRVPELSYNWVAADQHDITYRVSLEVPARHPIAPTREPWRVMDGDDPLSLWPGGSLPASELPRGRAAERGFVVTANNDPFGFTENGRADDDPWYYGAFFDPGYRAGRIDAELERLTARGGVTLAELQTLQNDVHSNLSDDLLPLLADAAAARDTDPALSSFRNRPELDALVALLTDGQAWDRRMARDQAGAVAFHAFAHFLAGRVLEDDVLSIIYERILEEAPFYVLKVATMALQGAFPAGDAVLQGGAHFLLLQALEDTALFLTERFGGVDPAGYRYADLRVTNLDNGYGLGMPLRQVPTDGGEDTVNVAHGVFRRNLVVEPRWVSDYGPVERLAARFDERGRPQLHVNFPMGNVADPTSPHFDDALEGWVEGTSFVFPFEEADVAAATERTFEIARP